MSLDTTSRRIHCDSLDCGESLPVPIHSPDALPAVSESRVATKQSAAAGWVFVSSTYEDRHYCPNCAEKLLPRRAA